MTKKLCTFLLSTALAGAAFAQAPEHCSATKDCASFAPKKGQWEFSMMLGKSKTFYNENTSFLLPNINLTGSSIGLPNGGVPGEDGTASGFLNPYLNINGFNDNSLVNIIGIQGKYFWQDCWAVSLSGGMSIGVTPQKNYIESTILDEENGNILNEIPSSKYINATATNNFFVNVGTERYFQTKNKRIFPYVGVNVGFQMARVETREPYTGNMVDIDNMTETTSGALGSISDATLVDKQVYIPAGKVGQMFALKGAAVAGVEYDIMPGMFLALEFNPLSYRYDVIQIAPQGFGTYSLNHHTIKIFDMPTLRIGFRF
ncbi:MAG: hypothetical protein HDS35_05520 [Bacteroides sp.]|nr:hypothetical protein [Bacteroides sp.]